VLVRHARAPFRLWGMLPVTSAMLRMHRAMDGQNGERTCPQ
jgi:hypothetical protein